MMKDEFQTYKKTLENYFIQISYLYSGDVVSEIQKQYVENIKNENNSAIFIKNFLLKVYYDSFKYMIDNVDEQITIPYQKEQTSITKSTIQHFILMVNEKISFQYNTTFSNYVDYKNDLLFFKSINRSQNIKDSRNGKIIKNYPSPLIPPYNQEEKYFFYLLDNPIQSFVYILQNMDYVIEKCGDSYNHIITYPFYYCDFNVKKIVITDTKKIVRDKIKTILS